jgi:homoserine O-succinyltransferase
MPVRIDDGLPARRVLEEENIFVMGRDRALHQDIRPLKIAVLNLMPTKIVTETQILRLLSNSPLQIDVSFIRMLSHESRNTSSDHIDAFYRSFRDIRHDRFDGLVVTGAPVETLPFEEVDYWPELCELLDWSREAVFSTLYICWGAQAGLYRHFGIGKRELPAKLSGIYEHRVLAPKAPLLRGFDELFPAPHSRYTEALPEKIRNQPGLEVLAESDEAGIYIAATNDGRMVFVSGHPEYDRDTLKAEYERDIGKGIKIAPPVNYFPGGDTTRAPVMRWRAHAHLLYSNWLNYHVYQLTPYDLETLKR